MVWRIRSSPTKLVCAVGSRNGTEETKLLVLDFDAEVSEGSQFSACQAKLGFDHLCLISHSEFQVK